jgi:hypothetical protein
MKPGGKKGVIPLQFIINRVFCTIKRFPESISSSLNIELVF